MIQVYDKYGKIKSSGTPGAGTITSFSAGNLSPLFTTTVTSPTSTPNLAFSAVSQAQNLFYASPNGVSGVPSFRAILASDLPFLSTLYVPYTGATSNVNLGTYGLLSEYLEVNTTPTTYTPAVGRLGWNNTDGTIEFKLKGGNVTLQIGQEQVIRVVNKTTPLINLLESNYQVCVISGATGQRVSVRLAQADNDANSAGTLGVVTENINANQEGFITTGGQVKEINTTGSLQGETWNDGDVLYLSPTIAGALTNIKPIAPNHTVIVGYVEYAHAVHGKIFVKIDNGYELDELHNVRIVNPLNGQILTYNSTLGIWENKTVTVVRNTTTSSYITGTSAETQITSFNFVIPANTYTNLDLLRIETVAWDKLGTNNASTCRIKLSNTNNYATASNVLILAASGGNINMRGTRTYKVVGGNLKGFMSSAANGIFNDNTLSNIAHSTLALDFTQPIYGFVSLQTTSTLDSVAMNELIISKV